MVKPGTTTKLTVHHYIAQSKPDQDANENAKPVQEKAKRKPNYKQNQNQLRNVMVPVIVANTSSSSDRVPKLNIDKLMRKIRYYNNRKVTKPYKKAVKKVTNNQVEVQGQSQPAPSTHSDNNKSDNEPPKNDIQETYQEKRERIMREAGEKLDREEALRKEAEQAEQSKSRTVSEVIVIEDDCKVEAPTESTPTRPHIDRSVGQADLRDQIMNDILELTLDLASQASNGDVNAWSNFRERIESLNDFYMKNRNCLESRLDKVRRLNEDFLKWSYRLAANGVGIVKLHRGYAELFNLDVHDQVQVSNQMHDQRMKKRSSIEEVSSEKAKKPKLLSNGIDKDEEEMSTPPSPMKSGRKETSGYATHTDSGTSRRSPKESSNSKNHTRFAQEDFHGQHQSTRTQVNHNDSLRQSNFQSLGVNGQTPYHESQTSLLPDRDNGNFHVHPRPQWQTDHSVHQTQDKIPHPWYKQQPTQDQWQQLREKQMQLESTINNLKSSMNTQAGPSNQQNSLWPTNSLLATTLQQTNQLISNQQDQLTKQAKEKSADKSEKQSEEKDKSVQFQHFHINPVMQSPNRPQNARPRPVRRQPPMTRYEQRYDDDMYGFDDEYMHNMRYSRHQF